MLFFSWGTAKSNLAFCNSRYYHRHQLDVSVEVAVIVTLRQCYDRINKAPVKYPFEEKEFNCSPPVFITNLVEDQGKKKKKQQQQRKKS